MDLHNNLGTVTLQLSFDNGDFQFKCQPIHAGLILYFGEEDLKDNEGITPEQLSKELGISVQLAKQKMMFWVHNGVVREIKRNEESEPVLFKRSLTSYGYFSNADPLSEQGNIIYQPVKVLKQQ